MTDYLVAAQENFRPESDAGAPPAVIDVKALHDRVLAAYEGAGCSRAVIAGWAISDNDVEDFVTLAHAAQPRRILEVGTHVGVSTMLLALVCPRAEIFTVDPDFPVSIEDSAVVSGDRREKEDPTVHEVARRAAQALGVLDRIRFFKGGFSIPATFASTLTGEGEVPVVGPDLCREHGPFDFIFVDGLHTAAAVASDLELAAPHLTPDGVMVLHDCIGFWGANVRAGVFDFLRKHSGLRFVHPRYDLLYKSVGTIRTRTEDRASAGEVRDPIARKTLPESVRQTLVQTARNALGDGAVLELRVGDALFDDDARSVALAKNPARFASALGKQLADGDFAGLFSAELADFGSDEALASAIKAAREAELPLVLATTPPGERGVAGPHSRPLARLIDIAEAAGAFVFAAPALDLEPARYPLLSEPRDLGLSSLFASVVVVAPEPVFVDALDRPLARLTAEAAAEREQLEIQRVHIAASFRRYFEERERVQESLATAARLERDQIEIIRRVDEERQRIAIAADRAAAASEAEKAAMQSTFQSAQTAFLETLETTKAAFHAAMLDMAAQVSEAGAQKEAQRAALMAEMDAQRAQFAARVAEVEAARDSARASLTETEAQLANARQTIATQHEHIASLDDRIATLNGHIASLDAKIEEQHHHIASLDAHIAELNTSFADRIAELSAAHAAHADDLLRRLVASYGAIDVIDEELAKLPGATERLGVMATLTPAPELIHPDLSAETDAAEALAALQSQTSAIVARQLQIAAAIEPRLTALSEEISRMTEENARLSGALDQLYRSTSWRLSKPIRWIGRKVGRPRWLVAIVRPTLAAARPVLAKLRARLG